MTTVFDMKTHHVTHIRCLWFKACFELRFSLQWVLSLRSAAVWHRVVCWNCTGVSKLLAASIFSLRPVVHTTWHHDLRDDGCSNSGHLVSLRTKFYMVARNIFSVILALIAHCIQKCISVHVHWTESARWQWRSRGIPKLWVPQCDICFTSPFWHLKFGGGSRFLGSLWTRAL
jgi:hypothetical protein